MMSPLVFFIEAIEAIETIVTIVTINDAIVAITGIKVTPGSCGEPGVALVLLGVEMITR